MKPSITILLATLLLAACGYGNDNKPMMEPQRSTLEKSKQVDSTVQQQVQQQQQEAEKQTQ